ncbi:MAG TPA: M48 family metallopeptidase [Chloroflexia bacterium]|nr:M48 family metallopeptidase [Chloroflexia bacterium]
MHSIVLIMFLEGCKLLIGENWRNLPMSVVGALLVGLAWAMRPRLGQVPTDRIIVRSEFPALYAMADQITEALGTKKIDVIYVDSDFSAAFATVGLFRKNVLFLGIPLFSVLTHEERVALMGHEIGHGANGDSARGIVVGGAVSSLAEWRNIFPLDGAMTLIILPIALFFVQLPRLVLYLLVHLLASDSQRAEYLADHMGARVGGTAGMLNLLHKLHIIEALAVSADRYFERGCKHGVLDTLRKRVETIPPREIERIKRVEKLLDSRLDSTHPPTRYRIELLEARPVNEPEVVLSPEHIADIEAELALIAPYVEEWMLDSYRLRMGL